MESDAPRLDALLQDRDCDGYLLDSDACRSSNQRYLSRFVAEDSFLTLYTPERIALLVTPLEYERARSESSADEVHHVEEYDGQQLARDRGPDAARSDVITRFLDQFQVDSVLVPRRFPVWTADALRDRGVVVIDVDDALRGVRSVKAADEIASIRETKRAAEAAMRSAERLLSSATVKDGVLRWEGAPLTSERVKHTMGTRLFERGCVPTRTVVASGTDAAHPHADGDGPIAADVPVVVDVFPRHRETGYHADMTRTFVAGEPSDEIRAWHDLTERAMDAALDALEPGVAGKAVDDAVCAVYEDAGYPTLRRSPTTDTGFVHDTGHGLGLDVHEPPRLGQGSDAELEAGNVVTVEPGLYDPEVGGVRVEDVVAVTANGYECLTDYPHDLSVV